MGRGVARLGGGAGSGGLAGSAGRRVAESNRLAGGVGHRPYEESAVLGMAARLGQPYLSWFTITKIA